MAEQGRRAPGAAGRRARRADRRAAKEELFNLRFQLATGQLDNPPRIKEVRHEVARIATVLREREIELELDAIAAARESRSRDERRRGRSERRQTTTAGAAPARCATGVVVSDGMDKTVRRRGSTARSRHPLYNKTVRRSPSSPRTTRPTTRTWATRSASWRPVRCRRRKRWRVVEVVERAK